MGIVHYSCAHVLLQTLRFSHCASVMSVSGYISTRLDSKFLIRDADFGLSECLCVHLLEDESRRGVMAGEKLKARLAGEAAGIEASRARDEADTQFALQVLH